MGRYIAKRLAVAALTVFIILFVLFMLLNFMPGSPFNNEEKMKPEQIATLKAAYGLDKPVIERFFIYVGNMLRGDFGVSYNIQNNMPIATMVGSRLKVTLGLGLEAGIVGAIVGNLLGILAALKRHTPVDTVATVIAVLGVSLPNFVFALLLSYFFGYKLKLFPLTFNPADPVGSSVLPVIALSMFTLASMERYTRSELVSIMDSDYMLLAESKGLPRRKLIMRHALRNALISLITVLAPLLVNLMSGSIVIEKIFSIPGLGTLYITAIQSNDYNVVLATSFIYSVMFVIAMLLVDLAYGLIDPRVRLAGQKG